MLKRMTLVLTVIGLGCAVFPTTAAPSATSHSHGSVTYTLAWTRDDATLAAGSWRMRNNLGYDIRVERVALVTAAVQLLPCADSKTARSPLAPRIAHAGHGEGADPARWAGPRLETLQLAGTATNDAVLGSAVLKNVRYCRAHYLLAAGAGQPTIDITGAVRAPGATHWTLFAIRSTLAWGGIVDLDAPTALAQAPRMPRLVVTVTRDFAALFDGVDFATMNADERGRQVLRALITHSTVAARSTDEITRPNNTYHDE